MKSLRAKLVAFSLTACLAPVVALIAYFTILRGQIGDQPSVGFAALAVAAVAVVAGTTLFSRSILRPVRELLDLVGAVAKGDYTRKIEIKSRDELECWQLGLGISFLRTRD